MFNLNEEYKLQNNGKNIGVLSVYTGILKKINKNGIKSRVHRDVNNYKIVEWLNN